MDEETRIFDLVNNPTPAMVAAYFYRMYPDDYTWRRYGSMLTRGWSGRDTRDHDSSDTGESGRSQVQWRHYGTQPVGLVYRTIMGLVRRDARGVYKVRYGAA